MSRLQEADRLVSGLDDDLGHKCFVVTFGKHRLNPVGLRTNGINEGDVIAVWIAINVVAAWKPVPSSECGGKNHAVLAFHGNKMFTHDEGGSAVVGKVVVKLSQVIAHRIHDCGFGLAERNALCLRWPVRNQLWKR